MNCGYVFVGWGFRGVDKCYWWLLIVKWNKRKEVEELGKVMGIKL